MCPLETVSVGDFSYCFHKREHLHHCIAFKGDCFEGDNLIDDKNAY